MRILRKLNAVQSCALLIGGLLFSFWALRLPTVQPLTLKRLEFVLLATACSFWTVCGWSALIAGIARRRGWTPSCVGIAAFPFFAGWFLAVVLGHGARPSFLADLLLSVAWGVAALLPRLAFTKSELSSAARLTTLNLHP